MRNLIHSCKHSHTNIYIYIYKSKFRTSIKVSTSEQIPALPLSPKLIRIIHYHIWYWSLKKQLIEYKNSKWSGFNVEEIDTSFFVFVFFGFFCFSFYLASLFTHLLRKCSLPNISMNTNTPSRFCYPPDDLTNFFTWNSELWPVFNAVNFFHIFGLKSTQLIKSLKHFF